MKVIDHYFDAKTGARGTRVIEVPGVLTQEEAVRQQKEEQEIRHVEEERKKELIQALRHMASGEHSQNDIPILAEAILLCLS
jgi:hypothetical protein